MPWPSPAPHRSGTRSGAARELPDLLVMPVSERVLPPTVTHTLGGPRRPIMPMVVHMSAGLDAEGTSDRGSALGSAIAKRCLQLSRSSREWSPAALKVMKCPLVEVVPLE